MPTLGLEYAQRVFDGQAAWDDGNYLEEEAVMTLLCMQRSPCGFVGGMTVNDMDEHQQKAPPKVGMILGALRQRLKDGDDDDEEVVQRHLLVAYAMATFHREEY